MTSFIGQNNYPNQHNVQQHLHNNNHHQNLHQQPQELQNNNSNFHG